MDLYKYDCENSFCNQKNSSKTEKIKINGETKFLCSVCYWAFSEGQYCCFCLQVYPLSDINTEADGKEWIECESCKKWVNFYFYKMIIKYLFIVIN